jgi:hypothetical protein
MQRRKISGLYLRFGGVDVKALDGVLGLLDGAAANEGLADWHQLIQKLGKRFFCK